MDTDAILAPIIQYGFAGFSAVLLIILVWLTRALLKALTQNTHVIDRNTSAIETCTAGTTELRREVRGMKEEFLKRPCIAKAAVVLLVCCLASAAYADIRTNAQAVAIIRCTNGHARSKATAVNVHHRDGIAYALTNAHVVQGYNRFSIWPAGHDSPYDAGLLYVSPRVDVAVLTYRCSRHLAIAPLAESIRAGEPCHAVGFPADSVRNACHSGHVRLATPSTVIASFTVQGGESGSPLLDSDGRLAGLVWGAGALPPYETFAVSVDSIRPILVERCNWQACGPDGCTSPPPIVAPVRQPLTPIQKPGGLTVDYDRLAAIVVEQLAADPRFEPQPGPPGTAGRDGLPGQDGKDGLPGRDGNDGAPGPAAVLDDAAIAAVAARVKAQITGRIRYEFTPD